MKKRLLRAILPVRSDSTPGATVEPLRFNSALSRTGLTATQAAINQHKTGLSMTSVGSRRDSDGRLFSPVVRANSKFFGDGRGLCVDVRFKNVEQLDAVIAALVKLREFPDDGFDHVHLQDNADGTARSHPAGAEVTFWHPSVKRDAGAKECVSDATAFFKGLRSG